MHQIRPWLYVGTRHDCMNPGLLYGKGIKAILQLAVKVKHQGIVTKYVKVEDAGALHGILLREGVYFVLEQRQKGSNILIACSAGISRSVAFTAAALREAEGLSLPDALQEIKRQHPDANPHPLLWESLCEYYQEGGRVRQRSRKQRRRRE